MTASRLVLAAFGAVALMASVAPAHAEWRGGGRGYHDRGGFREREWRGHGWRGPAWRGGYYRPYYARPYVYAPPPPVYYYGPRW